VKWKRFGFLRHYRKIKIEGFNLSNVVNKCIGRGISLRHLRWKTPLESTVEVSGEQYDELKRAAGNSYRFTVIGEGGAFFLFKSMKANTAAITGAFLLGALIFYQSIFVAEIRIDGYSSISEENLHRTLAEAGLYEGVRKPEDYGAVKEALYDEFDNITWVSIFENGQLVEVQIAEAAETEEAKMSDETPTDIVAGASGTVETILPLTGNACVKKGDYVSEGDLLISGTYEYQSTDYSRGDEIFTMYSHADGQVIAKVPLRLTYYLEKNERKLEKTGSSFWGIYIKIGDAEIDTAVKMNRYEVSERSERTVLDIVRPIPVTISFIKIEEAIAKESRQSEENLQKVVDAAVRQYARENFDDGESISTQSVEYTDEAGVIRAEVMLEVLQDIGVEQEIDVKEDEDEAESGEKDGNDEKNDEEVQAGE